VHPVGGATAKLHTQNRTFRKFATHAPTGAAALVSAPNFVQPLNSPLHFLSLPYLPSPPFLPCSLLISPSIPSSRFPTTLFFLSPLLRPVPFPTSPSPFSSYLPTPFPPSLPISPHSLSPLQFHTSNFLSPPFPLIPSLTPPIPSFPYPFLHFVVTFFVVSSNFVTIQAGDTRYPTLMHCPSGSDAIRRRFFCFFLPSLSSSPLPFGYKKITL